MVTGHWRRVQGRHPSGIGSSPGVVARRGLGLWERGSDRLDSDRWDSDRWDSDRWAWVNSGRTEAHRAHGIHRSARPGVEASPRRGLRAPLTKEHEGEHASEHDNDPAAGPPDDDRRVRAAARARSGRARWLGARRGRGRERVELIPDNLLDGRLPEGARAERGDQLDEVALGGPSHRHALGRVRAGRDRR